MRGSVGVPLCALPKYLGLKGLRSALGETAEQGRPGLKEAGGQSGTWRGVLRGVVKTGTLAIIPVLTQRLNIVRRGE
jgi:hypothetical protein